MFIFPVVIFTVVSCGGGGGGDSPPAASSAPTGVTAAGGDNSASIGWTAVAGATSYNIYYSTTSGVPKATATKIAGVTTTPKIVTGLNNGTTYYFVVTAVDARGESPDSSPVSATPALAPPPAPTAVTGTAGHGEAAIGWDNVAGATSYNIYYSTTPGVTNVTANRFTEGISPYIATGLINGTTYYFAVTAVNAAGEGPVSTEVSATPTPTPPAVPTGVTATAGHGEATISWSAVTGATSYIIYFDNTPGVTKTKYLDKLTGVTTSPKSVTGLVNGTTYYFVVTAVSDNGESIESSQVSATPTPVPPPPPAPTGVTATAGHGEATISWSAVMGATSYNIYYSTTTGVTKTTGTKVADVTSPRIVTPLTNGTTWYFVVTAVNADGESVESSQVSALPNAISLVEYIAVGDSITLGQGDNNLVDGTGYEPILSNLLSTRPGGHPITVANEGVGGTSSADGAANISLTLSKYPSAIYYLVQYGTNDAYIFGPPVPSGKGLHSGDLGYNGSYKHHMKTIISAIKNAGKVPFLAKVPYTANSKIVDSSIQDYNAVINELVTEDGILFTPPNFYTHFLNHPEEYTADGFHPNGTGYQSMANLWFVALFP